MPGTSRALRDTSDESGTVLGAWDTVGSKAPWLPPSGASCFAHCATERTYIAAATGQTSATEAAGHAQALQNPDKAQPLRQLRFNIILSHL